MIYRLSFGIIALFWVVMNVLLWRSEFRGEGELGSSIPAGAVWERILTAPDDSSLEILRDREKIGYCRWRANVGEEVTTGKTAFESTIPEGMVKELTGYTIDLEGNFLFDEPPKRLRFEMHADFRTDHHWSQLRAKASMRPAVWELRADAAAESLALSWENEDQKWERQLSFSDLRQPARLLEIWGIPLPVGLLPLGGNAGPPSPLAAGLHWEARHDWFQIGRSKVRVYRLQARLFDRYQIVILVSRVGEILRVELPNGWLLVNDAFIAF